MKKNYLWFIVLPVLFTGCAFTVSKTPLNYSYQGETVNFPSSAKIEIAQFIDKRNVTDGRIIFQKRNDYGETSGAYEAEKPMVDIIRDSIMKTFEDAGDTINSNSSKVRLEGDLISNDYQVLMGFWKGKVTNTMTMKFRLVDTRTGGLIWQDTVFGKHTEETVWGGTEVMLRMVKGSIDDLIYMLMNDKFFRQQLEMNGK